MNGEPIVIESGGGSNGGGMFGMGEGSGLFIILFLLILFDLFGNGNGFGGNRCGNDGGGLGTVLPLVMNGFGSGGGHSCGSSVAEQFALNNLQSGIDAIRQGQCTGTYDLIGAIKDCCCQTQGSIKDVRFDISSGLCSLGNMINMTARDIMDKTDANYRGLMDFLVQDKISTLTAENNRLQMAASQANQNAVLMAAMDANKAEILRRTGVECPTAAFLVNPPTPVNFPTNSCGQVQFGGNGYGGCGNGCGCGGW